jgi:ArsR family metal-binding transcriptional regulator
MVKFKVVRLCKQDAMSVVPTEVLRFDLEKAAEILKTNGYEATMQGPMLIAKKDIELTLYASGRMLLSKVESKEKAVEMANRVYAAVEGAVEGSTLTKS